MKAPPAIIKTSRALVTKEEKHGVVGKSCRRRRKRTGRQKVVSVVFTVFNGRVTSTLRLEAIRGRATRGERKGQYARKNRVTVGGKGRGGERREITL